MTFEPRYYVHSFQHRGEKRVWHVADRQTPTIRDKFVSHTYFSEKPCRKMCDRMNADWQKYLTHRLAEHSASVANK